MFVCVHRIIKTDERQVVRHEKTELFMIQRHCVLFPVFSYVTLFFLRSRSTGSSSKNSSWFTRTFRAFYSTGTKDGHGSSDSDCDSGIVKRGRSLKFGRRRSSKKLAVPAVQVTLTSAEDTEAVKADSGHSEAISPPLEPSDLISSSGEKRKRFLGKKW